MVRTVYCIVRIVYGTNNQWYERYGTSGPWYEWSTHGTLIVFGVGQLNSTAEKRGPQGRAEFFFFGGGGYLWENGNELRGLRATFWRGPSYHGVNMRNRLFVPDFLFDFYTVRGSIGTSSVRPNGSGPRTDEFRAKATAPAALRWKKVTANGSNDTSWEGD